MAIFYIKSSSRWNYPPGGEEVSIMRKVLNIINQSSNVK
jgi:hypothetical protein